MEQTITLKGILAALCADSARTLAELYEAVPKLRPGTKETTIRGTIYQNRELFRRVAPGIYIAARGDARAVVLNGDAWDLIRGLDDDSVDAIITDTAFAELNRGRGRADKEQARSRALSYAVRTPDAEMLRELLRVIRKDKPGLSPGNEPRPIAGGGWAFFWAPATTKRTRRFINDFIDLAESVGWVYQKSWIAAHGRMGSGYYGRNAHDQWLVFSAPDPIRGFDESVLDTVFSSFIEARDRCHQAEKAEDTFEPMLRFATQPGDLVLDPFCGGMSLLRAAVAMGRNALGFEVDPAVTARALGEALPDDVVQVTMEEAERRGQLALGLG